MDKHIIVTYSAERAENGHVDPNFTQLIYGNNEKNGTIFRNNVSLGSYVFFNTRIGDKRYITAYFYVEKILRKGEHDLEIAALTCDAKDDDVIMIGSRTLSKVLTIPLLLDKELMMKIISFGADEQYFKKKDLFNRSELQAISDITLNPCVITETEKEMLIELCKDRG